MYAMVEWHRRPRMGGPKLGIFCAQSSHFRETTFAVPARDFAQPLHQRGLPSGGSP